VTLVQLYPVADGRCPCCGRTEPIWTPAAILEAMRAWARQHEGRAPTVTDWRRAQPGCPSADQVIYVFGSFPHARDAAGLAKPKYRLNNCCRRGHKFTDENTYIDALDRKHCRKCRADAMKRLRQRRAA